MLPVQLYKTCCTLQGMFTADLAGVFAGAQSSSIGAFAGQILSIAFVPSEAAEVGLKLIFFLLAFAYCVISRDLCPGWFPVSLRSRRMPSL